MVLTREPKSLEGAIRLLATASRELDQATLASCRKYDKQIRLMAVLADSISRRVYADIDASWKARVVAERAESAALKRIEAKHGWRTQITEPRGNEHAD